MILRWFFDERTVAIDLPLSNKNEHTPKKCCKKSEFYTNGKVKFNIICATRKTKSLFKIKDNIKHLSCVMYKGICSCGHNHIRETIRDVVTKIENTNNQMVNRNLLNTWRTTQDINLIGLYYREHPCTN